MASAANLLGTLNNIGLEDYEVAQGAPVSVSSVGGVTSTSVGTLFSGNGGVIVIVAIVVFAIFLLGRGRK